MRKKNFKKKCSMLICRFLHVDNLFISLQKIVSHYRFSLFIWLKNIVLLSCQKTPFYFFCNSKKMIIFAVHYAKKNNARKRCFKG